MHVSPEIHESRAGETLRSNYSAGEDVSRGTRGNADGHLRAVVPGSELRTGEYVKGERGPLVPAWAGIAGLPNSAATMMKVIEMTHGLKDVICLP